MTETTVGEFLLAQVGGHGGEEAVGGAVHGAEHAAGSFEFTEMFHHIQDHALIAIPPVHIGGVTFDFSITKFILMMWISGLLSLLVFGAVGRRIRDGRAPRGAFANLFESLFLFVRDEMVYNMMGKEAGRRYAPYFSSLFFFILFCNLFGLIPFMNTATGNLAVTGGLAVLTFLMTQAGGMRAIGVVP